MNLYDSVIRAFPRHSYRLNGAGTGYTDITNNGGTVSGTLTFSSPIVSSNAKSLLASSVANTVTTDVFRAGREREAFTLEAWFMPLSYVGNISILSHSGVFDGLWFDGDFIRFKVAFTNGTIAEVKWPVDDRPKVYHIVGSYSSSEVLLYIDKELIGSYEISEADVASGFANAASGNLVIGQASNATLKALVDGVAAYSRPLTDTEITRNNAYGLDPSDRTAIYSAYSIVAKDGSVRDVALRKEWASRRDWASGQFTRTAISEDGIVPETNSATNISVTNAIWADIFEVGSLEFNPLYGIKAEWDGDGSYIVATSTDGVNYTNLVNGNLIPNTVGMNPANKVMDIRIGFVGGIANDPAIVRRLEFTAYRSAEIVGMDRSRTLAISGDVSTGDNPFLVMERSEADGIQFNGGTVTLSTDSSDQPKTVKIVEMWVKPRGVVSGTSATLFSTTGASVTINDTAKTISWTGMSAVYANGAAITTGAALKYNEWTHLVFVLTTASSAAFTFGTTFLGSLSHIGISDQTMTAAQALSLFNSYFSNAVAAVTEVGTVAVAEPAGALKWYEYNWGGQTAY